MARTSHRGFTLIELMVTLTVITVLLLIAVPSFESFRQRAAVRGATARVFATWQQARMEAAKRNTYVKFGALTSGTDYCVGASTQGLVAGAVPTASTVGVAACDCFETDTTDPDYCDVARFPIDQAEWNRVRFTGTPSLGQNNGFAIIEPKNTMLTDFTDGGAVSLAGPTGRRNYRLNLRVDGLGRALVCQSTATGVDSMSDFADRRCSP
jgi:type IV fimbrial biogenesis protein FimT